MSDQPEDLSDLALEDTWRAAKPGETPGQMPPEGQCEHPHWKTRMRGGEPLSIRVCSLCGDVDWKQLQEDLVLLRRSDEPLLGLATTRQLLDEIAARGRTEVYYSTEGSDMALGAESLKRQLPGSMLEYRTVDAPPHVCAEDCRHDFTERPEDTVRRYAGRLLELQEGLQHRGYDLSECTEDGLVAFVFDALDHERAEAAYNARRLGGGVRVTKAKMILCIGGANHGKLAPDYGDTYYHSKPVGTWVGPSKNRMRTDIYRRLVISGKSKDSKELMRPIYVSEGVSSEEAMASFEYLILDYWLRGGSLEDNGEQIVLR